MSLDELGERIRDILKLVETLPEPYRLKAFELLLGNELSMTRRTQQPPVGREGVAEPLTSSSLPIDVRALLVKHSVPETVLQKMFLTSGKEIKPIYEIETTKRARAQIQIACLTALENALKGGKFEFSQEDVRQRVKERKCYDGPNFRRIFKNNANLFKDLIDEEHVELSPQGKAELAGIILEITK